MAPKNSDPLIQLCRRAIELGNGISVRMLEYLSSAKKHPVGFKELAISFLEISRVLWPIESGLAETSRQENMLGNEMITELEKKFRTTIDDFNALNQLLLQFLGYQEKKGFSKWRQGWGMMFIEGEIERRRISLGKNRDALRMSALVFQWSTGTHKTQQNVSIGYTGLKAALESINKGQHPASIPVVRPLPTPPPEGPLPLPPSGTQLRSHPLRNDSFQTFPLPSGSSIMSQSDIMSLPLTPPASISHQHNPMIIMDNELDELADQFDTATIKMFPHGRSSMSPRTQTRSVSRMTDRQPDMFSDTLSQATVDIDDMLSQLDDDTASSVLVRMKADPKSAPRWKPKSTSGASSPALKQTLIKAVQQKKLDVAEQLLDCGVKPDVGPESNLLREAILNRDASMVRLLLLYGADPNGADEHEATPLHAATELCFIEAASMLLKYGANPNQCGGQDESALAMAVVGNRHEFFQLYLQYGADVNEVMADGNTVMVKAMTKTMPVKLVEFMLRYGGDPNGKNGEGVSPLFQSISVNRVDLMTVLLDHGADPNMPGPKHLLWPSTYKPKCLQLLLSRGADPARCPGIMELATSINNIESISILLKANVDPNSKKDGTYTPLCSAIRDNRSQIVSLLLASGADPNVMALEHPTYKCITYNRTHFLPELVAAGADLHTPKGIVEKCIRHNNRDALMYVLEHDVDVNARSKEGYTALTTAIRDNRTDLVSLLLERGADPSVRGQEWPICMAVKQPALLSLLLPAVHNPRAIKGVLEMAVVASQLESVKLLLAAGVSVEDKNGGVFSPLTTSIREDRKEIFNYLLDHADADVNAPGEHLPVIKAIRRHKGVDLSYIERLLEKGADINKMYRGWNAVLQAVEGGEASVLRLLVERGGGVDLEVEDETGRTVLEIVQERGWDEAVTILLGDGPGPVA